MGIPETFAETLAGMLSNGVVDKDQAMKLWDEYRMSFGPLPTSPAQNPSGGLSVGGGSSAPKVAVGPRQISEQDAYRVLMLRLRVPNTEFQQMNVVPGLKTLHLYQDTDKVYVFIVSAGGPVVLEDEPSLFPSDKLIAEITLLKG